MSQVPPTTIEKSVEMAASPQVKSSIDKKYIYLGGVLLVLALAILVVLVVLAVQNPIHTETFRDIAIIALAAESGLIGLALLILIIQVARLTNMLEFEIKPILQNSADTVSTVRGTATFMSEHMVSPIIKASSIASGAVRLAGSVGSLFSVAKKGSPAKSNTVKETESDDGGEQ